jgi:hypothetical protein
MGNTAVSGYTDIIGKHGAWVGDHTGPASYTTGGETIQAVNFGLRSIDFVAADAVSFSGNYTVSVLTTKTLGAIKQTAKLIWRYMSTSSGVNSIVITTPGTGGTNGTVTIGSTGGGGTGATISVTTAGGIITSVRLLSPGTGYTSVPTFTIAAGTGVVTATIGAVAGVEVAAGVNLSGESVRMMAIGG